MTTPTEAAPTLGEQVTRLYDLIGGYHATHLLEIGRELGAWEAITAAPGVTSNELASRLGTVPFHTDVLCRTAFSFGLLDRAGDGWRMAPHMDTILGSPSATFYLGRAARVHRFIGEADYPAYPERFRTGTVVAYQDHGEAFMVEVGDGLQTLPRMFVDLVLPGLPDVAARLEGGARVLDLGCGSGWALVEMAERFPRSRFVGIDLEPQSIALAQARIAERALADRVEARLLGGEGLTDEAAFDVITTFLVVHEIDPGLKDTVLAAAARALVPGGSLVIWDEAYPETDEALRTMPSRFAAVAQWFELTWGNRIDSPSVLRERCLRSGLRIAAETTFSRFTILVAEKPA